jgi:hypothetical protein
MAGYSNTPLIKKLGIKAGDIICVLNPPPDHWEHLMPLPDDVEIIKTTPKREIDFIHLFAKDQKTFEKSFRSLKNVLKKTGMLWVSWPKKASGVATDLNENVIRDFGLDNGLVDVKVCAVDDTWSGLKFMFRTRDR